MTRYRRKQRQATQWTLQQWKQQWWAASPYLAFLVLLLGTQLLLTG